MGGFLDLLKGAGSAAVDILTGKTNRPAVDNTNYEELDKYVRSQPKPNKSVIKSNIKPGVNTQPKSNAPDSFIGALGKALKNEARDAKNNFSRDIKKLSKARLGIDYSNVNEESNFTELNKRNADMISNKSNVFSTNQICYSVYYDPNTKIFGLKEKFIDAKNRIANSEITRKVGKGLKYAALGAGGLMALGAGAKLAQGIKGKDNINQIKSSQVHNANSSTKSKPKSQPVINNVKPIQTTTPKLQPKSADKSGFKFQKINKDNPYEMTAANELMKGKTPGKGLSDNDILALNNFNKNKDNISDMA